MQAKAKLNEGEKMLSVSEAAKVPISTRAPNPNLDTCPCSGSDCICTLQASGEKWGKMTAEDKKPFQTKADADKASPSRVAAASLTVPRISGAQSQGTGSLRRQEEVGCSSGEAATEAECS